MNSRPNVAFCGTESNAKGVPQRALRVLIVDDEPEIITLVAAALKKWRFNCQYATDGATAIDLARTFLPEILVLDVMLPDLNGFEVLMLLKRDHRTRHIKIILLTSCDTASDIVRGYRLGADDYVTKPCILMELGARVKHLSPWKD